MISRCASEPSYPSQHLLIDGDAQRYMQEMITARRDADIKEERHDLFSSLLDANEGLAESGEKLSDTGLMGNVFIFMVAGALSLPIHTRFRRFVLMLPQAMRYG